MATTAGGLPYPIGTDKVVQGDDAIKALADALQLRGHGLRIESRHLVVSFDGAGVAIVPLAIAFPAAPVITVTAGVNDTNTSLVLVLFQPQIFTYQFTVAARTNAGAVFTGGLDIHYTATGAV